MQQKSWRYLVNRFLTDEITPAEMEELNRQKALSPAKEEQYSRFSNIEWWRQQLKERYLSNPGGKASKN
jgi:hypothetical protein